MKKPAFIITIDTEGDNLWQNHRVIKTENARYLARFQALCERFGFKPVWLTNYEMAVEPVRSCSGGLFQAWRCIPTSAWPRAMTSFANSMNTGSTAIS
ncbi:hypothetical protein AWI27_16640 [Enterobacter hormaechei subsp. steigerwaltii]|nr:hypothetical protein AWI27_16640 [Enterobacter hormaechei subsp. steigerwaltii]KZQ35336.1 hypothetical protein A3N44_20260 [Enterobacter hormaechei subsp. steigerwaltii]